MFQHSVRPQHVAYTVERGSMMAVHKETCHDVLEYTGDAVARGDRWEFDIDVSINIIINIYVKI